MSIDDSSAPRQRPPRSLAQRIVRATRQRLRAARPKIAIADLHPPAEWPKAALAAVRRYAWAIPAIIIVVAVYFNNFQNFDRFQSYDGPQHFNNFYSILKTGHMPQPPMTDQTYEAHQAPLFYYLSVLIAQPAEAAGWNGFETNVFRGIFGLAMGWLAAVVIIVGRGMRRVWAPFRTLTVSVIMLMPVNTLMAVMYGNDLPVVFFGLLCAAELWFMLRTARQAGHQSTARRWLRAAVFGTAAVAFKSNGLILLGTVAGLAGYLLLGYLMERRPLQAARILRAGALSAALMAIPAFINAAHSARYLDNFVGATTQQTSVLTGFDLRFFTTFDTSIFTAPFAWGRGEGSYWSLQYVQLHSDYYYHFNAPALAAALPPDQIVSGIAINRGPLPIEHLQAGVRLQYWAIPVTLLMIFGLIVAVARMIWDPRAALRDGSVLIVILFVVAQAAQFVRFASFAEIRAVTLHVRYMGMLWPLLLCAGVRSYWQILGRRRIGCSFLINGALLLFLTLYTVEAAHFLWLPAR